MAAELRIVEEKTEGVKARTVLWYMTFFGFAVNYIIRINASIALVDMIDMNYKKGGGNKTIVVSECIIADENLTLNSSISDGSLFAPPAEETAKYVSLERRFLDYLGVRQITSHHIACKQANTDNILSLSPPLSRLSTNVTDLNGTSTHRALFWDLSTG
jgi:urease alpha subunit